MPLKLEFAPAARRLRPGGLLALLVLSGCAVAPPRPENGRVPAPQLDTNVYFSSTAAQGVVSPDQHERDRYECNNWAVRQTGFDPSQPNLPPHVRVRVVAGGPPPGSEVAAGAVTGALVGAAVASPWRTGPGMLIGAIAGATIGGIAEAGRDSQAERAQAVANADADAAGIAVLERRATDYRRAMGACLDGRGYSVR
jgi:hypothetical protein